MVLATAYNRDARLSSGRDGDEDIVSRARDEIPSRFSSFRVPDGQDKTTCTAWRHLMDAHNGVLVSPLATVGGHPEDEDAGGKHERDERENETNDSECLALHGLHAKGAKDDA